MKKQNMRIAVSKRMLKEGLIRCLKTKDIDKISITELCAESGVNRATFYNHYQLPKDILLEIGWDHAEEIEKIFKENNHLPVKERITQCFTYLYSNKEDMKTLFSSNADKYIAESATDIFSWAWEQIIDLKQKISLDDDEYKLATTCFGYAAYYMLKQWITEDIHKTPEQLSDLFVKLTGNKLFS